MLSVALESNGSPKKRTFSRGISEDESLRSIIKETESSSSRRPTRSESRAGTLKRRSGSQHSEQDPFMGVPEMLELQASYDEVVQELRGLEVEREALLFQVDVLQDTLEGVEELLAEAQREASQAGSALEQERQAKRKLERMVCSLMQEVERLKEESNNSPPAPVDAPGDAEATRRGRGAETEEPPLCKNGPGQSDDAADEGSVLAKLKQVVSQSLSHVPSLALDVPATVDGILQRPYDGGSAAAGERDLSSAEQNDTDSLSAYEDASAETPEHERLYPGQSESLELPHDSDHDDAQQPKSPENCVVS